MLKLVGNFKVKAGYWNTNTLFKLLYRTTNMNCSIVGYTVDTPAFILPDTVNCLVLVSIIKLLD